MPESTYKICRWLDSSCGSVVLEATALPTEPQPLTVRLYFMFTQSSCWKNGQWKSWMGFERKTSWIVDTFNSATNTAKECLFILHVHCDLSLVQLHKDCQSRLKIDQILKNYRTLLISPKLQNIVKSGHTDMRFSLQNRVQNFEHHPPSLSFII